MARTSMKVDFPMPGDACVAMKGLFFLSVTCAKDGIVASSRMIYTTFQERYMVRKASPCSLQVLANRRVLISHHRPLKLMDINALAGVHRVDGEFMRKTHFERRSEPRPRQLQNPIKKMRGTLRQNRRD